MFDFVRPSHVKCRWRRIRGQRRDVVELAHHSARRHLRDPRGTFTVLWNTRISCLLGMTRAFSIIPHVQWNMLWVLHAELSSTLKPRPAKSYGLLILQLVWRVGLPSPQTFFNVCDSAASVRRNSFLIFCVLFRDWRRGLLHNSNIFKTTSVFVRRRWLANPKELNNMNMIVLVSPQRCFGNASSSPCGTM